MTEAKIDERLTQFMADFIERWGPPQNSRLRYQFTQDISIFLRLAYQEAQAPFRFELNQYRHAAIETTLSQPLPPVVIDEKSAI